MASESDSDDTPDPPLQHIYVKSAVGIFSFDGYELDFQDHRYSKNVAQYLPPLEPLRAKKGTVAARQPRHDCKPDAWWEAQCVFRGLSPEGSVTDLQNRLRGHEDDPIAESIQDTLAVAKKLLKKKNKEARMANWKHQMSDDEKAAADPKRFLKEFFPAGSRSREDTVLLTTHFVVNIQETAEELGLCCEYTHAPTDGDAVLQMAKYWVVIGRDKAAVTDRVRMIEREFERLNREQLEGQQELRRKNKELRRPKQTEAQDAVAKGKDWDVTGLWSISSLHIQGGWDVENLMMRIYLSKTGKGLQMFAEFDFGLLTGVFRFERQNGDSRSVSAADSSKDDNDVHEDDRCDETDDQTKFDHSSYVSDAQSCEEDDDVNDDEDEDEEDEEPRRSPTPDAFYFGSITQPSAQHPTWHYRYRGEDASEGMIALGSDDNLYSITFESSGQSLQGTFGGSVFGDCTFTGVKVGVGETFDFDISEEWASRNRDAFENARSWY